MKRNKITAAILSFVMSMSMLMPSIEVIADETPAPSETQKTESTENKEPKTTEKQEPKETEKSEPKVTEKQESKETETKETTKTSEKTPNETGANETSKPSEQGPVETGTKETVKSTETEASEPSATKSAVPGETKPNSTEDKTSPETNDPEPSESISETASKEGTVPSQSDSKARKNGVIASGDCGNSLTWSLDDEGTLTISGEGSMYKWSGETAVPWNSYRTEIQSIVFSNNLTSIGDYSFASCSNLKSIKIPENVTTIGQYAFAGCTGISNVSIPNGVKSIERMAFYNCRSINSIVLPNRLTTISFGVFSLCKGLTSITIPDGVTAIEDYAFEECSNLNSVTIPEGVTTIGDETFTGCSKLKKLILPYSVTSIGSDAFYDCSGLTSIVLNKSAYSEENFCNVSSKILHFYYNVRYLNDGNGTISGKSRTYGTDEIEFTVVPKSNYKIDRITLSYDEKTIELVLDSNGKCTMPEANTTVTVKAYFSKGVASGKCGDNLTWKLNVDGSLDIYGNGNMQDWNNETAVPWNDYRGEIKSINFTNGLKTIGNYAFSSCTKIQSVTIPDSVKTIGTAAFSGCDDLSFVVMNKNGYSQNAFPNTPTNAFHYYYNVNYTNDGNGTISGKSRTYGTDLNEMNIVPKNNFKIDKIYLIVAGKQTELIPESNGSYIMPD